MAIIAKVLIVFAIVATVQAGYAWSSTWPRQPAALFPPFSPFLPLPMPFAPFHPSAIHMPSSQEIASYQPGPNTNYNAVKAQSSSVLTRDKDGNIIKLGGSTVTANNNGEVNTWSVGNNPPDVNNVLTIPSIPDFDFPEIPDIEFEDFPEIPEISFPEFPKHRPFTFRTPRIPDIRHHVPKKNEKFTGFSSSSFTESSNVNGVKASRGGSDTAFNQDGHLDEDSLLYQEGDFDAVNNARRAHHESFKFKPHQFKPIHIRPPKPIDLEKIKNYVPKKNEKFVATHTSSFVKSSNKNGQKSVLGGSEVVINDNGKLDEEKVKFHKADKPKNEDGSTEYGEDGSTEYGEDVNIDDKDETIDDKDENIDVASVEDED